MLLKLICSGLVTLDIVDNYINNWGMVLIGTLECFAVGWVYKIDEQYAKVLAKYINHTTLFGAVIG